MGNAPSESNMGNRLRCYKCKRVLPPCKSFDDFYSTTINGQDVYVYNGGEYYRPIGRDWLYTCENCFYKRIRDQEKMRREEELRREEERRRGEKRKREEERRREKEKKMKIELDRRQEESHRQVQEQHENQLSLLEERVSKQHVLISQLDTLKANYESGSDKLLETLSSKCGFSIPNLNLSQLTSDQLRSVVSELKKLLFDEWIRTPPSLYTLQHTQVFITELCVLSQMSEDISLQIILNQVHSLVGSVSQSAGNTYENFMLTQALYLNLMHFLTDHGNCDSDAVLIAKRWAGKQLSTEDLFLVEFLGTLTSSLQNAVERASVFILKMEIQCLKLLLYTLTHLHDKEKHSKSSEMLLRLVQKNQWTPAEAVTLLKALSEKYAEEASITEVLTLVQVYGISPEWTDDSGHSLIQVLHFNGPDFRQTFRRQNESCLASALSELKTFSNLDDVVIDSIRNIITGVLQYSENAPKHAPITKGSFKCADTNYIQNALSQLCKAVLDTKGWFPTVHHMVKWCVLVLREKSRVLELVSVEEEPCVIAMIAATQVCRGNKIDIVLCSDAHIYEQTNEWSDFYKHLGISVNTNMKKSNASLHDVYEADIVYGIMDDFVSDYFQYGLEAMETGNPCLSRGFIIEERCLCASHDPKLSKLKENVAMVFAAEILESLMSRCLKDSEDIKLRHGFIKALFQVLHMNLNKQAATDSKIITVSQKLTGKQLTSNEIYILSILENLLKVFAIETESEKNRAFPMGKLCLDSLFACAVQPQASNEQTKELYRMLSNLVTQELWSPVEALNLLVAFTDRSHKEDCIAFMKILHLLEIYQVSSEWRDEKNQSICSLLNSCETKNMIQHLENSFRYEQEKSIDSLFDEIQQMKNIDEQTLTKSYSIVMTVTNLIKSGEIKKHTNVQQARNLSHSTDTEDLQEILAVLCNAVYECNAERKWWPRATQMISWCLLALSDTGKLLEMGTGEGKSCVIAMFAVLRALRGEKVDVVSSSSVLCQRDAEEWNNFYKYFGITADTNTNKTEDKDRRECYQKDVIYGTIEAFAADHLRQVFEMKDVRTDRSYQCIIIDEVDSLLLDQGVQLTYLSSSMVSMQHLNVILAMIWSHVSLYGHLSTGHQTFVHGPPASFFKAIFDSTDIERINPELKPLDILHIAEESRIVPEGLTEDICNSHKDELLLKLKTVSQEEVIHFFQEIEQYVPYCFTVYTLDDNGLLCLQKSSEYNNEEIPELTFLILGEGLCCPLYDSEETLIKPIADLILEKLQFTPCTNNKDKVSIPRFLNNLIEKKLPVWVQNAFLAMRLKQGREYVVENDRVCPVDFKSTGIVELSKKWGDGLQQFIEIKHQIKLSTISTITNYISNISFFEKYHGKIYGTTGTLGCEKDMLFLQELYPNLSACKMPTFNRKKLFEVKGTLKTSVEEWTAEIKHVVMAQISPNSYREGRAALVICETINAATELYEDLKSVIPGEIVLYSRSDKDSLNKLDKELKPGDVIVATNLAGRGTDIKVSKKVNNNGGLFVIVSFLSENTRVELQAFGRTARKGKPGSAMIIMTTDHLQESYRSVSSLEEAKKTRDRCAAERINDMRRDITEMKLREDLFSDYCKTLQEIHRNTDGDEQRAIVSIMNEFWGIWLQTKSDEIEKLKRNELQNSLKDDLLLAKSQSQSKTSPCSSIYHYINFGNIALGKKQWDISMRLFEKAMSQDESWAAIAFYSHAYCTIKKCKGDYITEARYDLRTAQASLKYLSEECMVCLQLVKMSLANSANTNLSSLEKQLTTKCKMFSYFDKNIHEAIEKLDKIKESGRDAVANKSPMFLLVSGADEDIQEEAYNLYTRGLKYVFSVEEEPRFPWGALLVFFLGVLQIIGGALLITFTFGTLASVGMGLITEGISDCIYGIESMVTGEFSWKQWAIEKAISIGISLIGSAVGKLLAKGYKESKLLIKGVGKELKLIPKFLSRQVTDSLVAKTVMKNALKCTIKRIAEEIVMYGFGKAEAKLLTEILNGFKNKIKKGILNNVKSNMKKEPMDELTNSIVLSHLEDQQQLSDLLQDENRKSKLLDIFIKLNRTALQSFYANLRVQNKLNSTFTRVINKIKSEVKGKTRAILTAIQTIHMGALAADAISTVLSLSDEFFLNLHGEMNTFNKTFNNGLLKKQKQTELSTSETEMLNAFKQDLADTISESLADTLTEVFHQKFSSHLASSIEHQVNGVIRNYVRTGLKSDRTEELLRAGQNSRYIAHMPVEQNPKGKLTKESVKCLESHAEKIMNQTTPGTIFDVRVLSETTGTNVVILTQDNQGKLTKMQQLNPSTKPANQTVTLIYYPKSAQHPDGHYDVLINNQRVSVTNEGKGCLFRALARGMKPNASEGEIALEADRLCSVEAKALLGDPGQWEPFIKRKEWTEAIRGGDWYMAEGAAKKKVGKIKENEYVLRREVGKVELYKEWKLYSKENNGIGQIINADHQPPVNSILLARQMNQNSKLSKAMLEVATNSSPLEPNLISNVERYHGLELPTVYVPSEIHCEFSSTKSKSFRQHLAGVISQDDVVGTLKLTIIGAMPRFQVNSAMNFKDFQNSEVSKSRLKSFERSLEQHSKKLTQTWYDLLKGKGVMTNTDLKTINTWIDKKGYKDQNDPHRNQVSNLLT